MRAHPSTLRLLPLLVLLVGAVVAPLRLSAQVADLVRDINVTGLDLSPGSPGPENFLVEQGKLFFLAGRGGSDLEPWVSDGTAVGTQQLADLCPGSCAFPVRWLAGLGGAAFFGASPAPSSPNRQLWRSDGTRAGTIALTDSSVSLIPGADASAAAVAHGLLFFEACTAAGPGCSLWESDGSPAGTQPVPNYGGGALGSNPLAAGNRVYVATQAGEVWVSDGTAGGTAPLAGLPVPFSLIDAAVAQDRIFFVGAGGIWVAGPNGGAARKVPQVAPIHPGASLVTVGRHAYFVVRDTSGVPQLWVTDGTAAGTARVSSFTADEAQQFPLVGGALAVAEVAGRVLFMSSSVDQASRRLWAVSGPSGTMVQLADVSPLSPLAALPGRAFYVTSSAHGENGNEYDLWSTEGSAGSGALLARGIVCAGCGDFVGLTVLDGAAFFGVDDGTGVQLWRSDGTARGTGRFTDLPETPGFQVQVPNLALLGGDLFFAASDPSVPASLQLWKSNGSPGGTEEVALIARTEASSTPINLTPLGGQLLFSAYDGRNRQLWQSAGTAASTSPLTSSAITSFDDLTQGPQHLVTANGNLFFWLGGVFGPFQLWRSDGTAAGTILLQSFADFVNTLLTPSAALGGRLFFSMTTVPTPPGQTSLWTSDGTPSGTAKVLDFPAATTPLESLTAAAGQLFFSVAGAYPQSLVYRSDGTPAGTVPLMSGQFDVSVPMRFTAVGNTVYFIVARDPGAVDCELWKTDGTAAGTMLVTGLGVYPQPSDLLAFGGQLYYFANVPNQRVLFRSDGTSAGTGPVSAFASEPPDIAPQHWLTALGSRLYFTASDGEHGRELWTSDGTTAGTTMLLDILPGPLASDPRWLTAAGGRLWFAADDGVHGFELWQSDGTAAGTSMVQDIAPGPASSYPDQLTAAGGQLFFTADDGAFGRELWALPLAPEGPVCQPGPTRLCLNGGRFRVEAAWRDFQGNHGVGMAAPLTADTGTFWFFSAASVEVIVKVLDGRLLNQSFWVFYGALSNVEYTITVTDTASGLTRRYFNPLGQLASTADTNAFGPLGELSLPPIGPVPQAAAEAPAPAGPVETAEASSASPCQAGPTRACLAGGRFAVRAVWRDFQGRTGTGMAVPLTDDTGSFWFFSADDVEVVLKVIDGRALNGKFWVFYGALSDVEYTLTVTDTVTGAVRTYQNPLGRLASVADTNAF